MAYMKDSTGRRLDSFKAVTHAETVRQAARALPGNVVAGNSFGIATATSQTKQGTSRSPHTFAVDASGIRLVYQNFFVNSSYPFADLDGTATLTIKASVESGGNIFRVTFRGQTSATVDPGGFVVSDPLGLEFTAGSTIYTRTYITGTTWYYNKTSNGSVGGGGFALDTDLTAPGSGTVADGTTALYAPSAVIGMPTSPAPSVALIGDSISNGIGDGGSSTDNRGIQPDGNQGGFVARAFHGKVPLLILSRPGDRGQGFNFSTSHVRRLGLVGGFTHAVCAYGRNDVGNSRTTPQLQADLIANWKLMNQRGMSVRQTTITPQTTSTDTWATVGNQAIANSGQEAVRVAVNTWIRAGAPMSTGVAVAIGTSGALLAGQTGHPLTGYLEVTDAVETARNSGIWKAAHTSDGLHPNTVGHTAMAAAVDVTLFTV